MVNFGAHLATHADPHWSQHYVRFAALKHAIVKAGNDLNTLGGDSAVAHTISSIRNRLAFIRHLPSTNSAADVEEGVVSGAIPLKPPFA